MPEVRRSARARQQKARYSTDAFAGLGPGFSASPSHKSSKSDRDSDDSESEFGPEEASPTPEAESNVSNVAESKNSGPEEQESELVSDEGLEVEETRKRKGPRRPPES